MVDEGPTTAATLIAKFKGDDSDVMQAIRRVKAAAIELGATDVTIDVDAKADAAVANMAKAKAAAEALDTSDQRLFATQKKLNNENGTSLQRWQAIALVVLALIPILGPLVGYTAALAGGFGAMGVAGIAAVVGIKHEMQQGTAAGNEYAAGIQVLKGNLNELGHTAAVAMLTSYDRVIGMIQARMPELNRDTGLFATQLGTAGQFIASGVLSGLQAMLPLLLTGGVYIERIAYGFQSWTQNGGLEKFSNYALNVLPQVAATVSQLAKLILDVVEASAPWGTVVLGGIRDVAQVLDAFPLPVLSVIVAGAIAGYGAFRLWKGLNGGVDTVRESMMALQSVLNANIPLTQRQIEKSAVYTALLTTEAGVSEAVAVGEAEMAAATVAAGTAFDFASGPIGIVFAALGALAAIISVVAAGMGGATPATQDYTAAVQQDTGAIGENVRAQAAKALQDSGALKNAKALGLATKTVTDAALGSSTAMDKVTAAQQKASDALDELKDHGEAWIHANRDQVFAAQKVLDKANEVVASTKAQTASIKDQIAAYNTLQRALGGSTISTQQQYDAQSQLATQYGLSLPAFLNATDANKKTADQAAATTNELRLQNDAVTLLNNAFTILNGGALDIAEAQTGAAAAFNTLTDSIKQNGKEIDGNSKAAVANQQAIQQKVLADQQAASAVQKTTGSVQAGVEAYAASKQALEEQLKAVGDLTPSMQAYIDKLYAVADFKPTTTVFDADTTAAQAKVAALQRQLDAISNGYSLIIGADGKVEGRTQLGTKLQAHARGGTVSGPGSSTSDSVPMWASVGEEYIKAASAQKVRPLLKAINADPERAVAGVMAAGAAVGSKVEKHSHLHIEGTGSDPGQLFSEFSRRENLGNQ